MKSKQHETPSKTTKKPAKTKDEYIESLAAELKEWSVQIDRLTDKMENAAGDVKLKYVEELEALRAKRHAAAEKMNELKDASGDAWETIKETADKLWDDLKVGVASAVSKFQCRFQIQVSRRGAVPAHRSAQPDKWRA